MYLLLIISSPSAFTLCPLHSSRGRDKTSAKWLQTLQPSMCCRLPWHRNYMIFYFMRSAGNPEDETCCAFENRHWSSCFVQRFGRGGCGAGDDGGENGSPRSGILSMFVWSFFHGLFMQVVALLLRTVFLYFIEISSLCFLDSWMMATQHTCIYLGRIVWALWYN